MLQRLGAAPLLQRWGLSLMALALAGVGTALVLAQAGDAHAEGASASASASASAQAQAVRDVADARRGEPAFDERLAHGADAPHGRSEEFELFGGPGRPGPLPVRHLPGADGPLVPGLRALGEPRLQQWLQLTAEQSARLQGLDDALRRDLDGLGRAQRAVHEQLGDALLKPTPDAAAIEALRAKLVAGIDARSRRELQAWRDTQAVLSPAQRARFAEGLREARQRAGGDDGAARPAPWREGPGGGEPGGRREPRG